MIVQSSQPGQLTIQLTLDEVALLANALNEIFEVSFEDGEFHTRLGSCKLEAHTLHHHGDLYQRTWKSRNSTLPSGSSGARGENRFKGH
jgi:hypothetical protein